jgi:hypothetical protein
LKGVERYTHRKDNVLKKGRNRHLQTQQRKEANGVVGEKMKVLEKSQQSQIDGHAQPQPESFSQLISRATGLNPFPGHKIDHRGKPQEKQKLPIPGTVENVTGQQQ